MPQFPTVQEIVTGRDASAGTSHVITMPSTINAGDFIFVIFCSDGAPTISVTGFTGTWSSTGFFTHTSNNFKGVMFYCYVAADDEASLTLSTSSSLETAHAVYRITGVNTITYYSGLNPYIGTIAYNQSTGTNADPDNSNPGVYSGTQDYLWLAIATTNDVVATVAPTDFTGLTTIQTVGGTGCAISTAYRQYRASSYNPGAFTTASDDWYSFNIPVVPPIGIETTMYRKNVSNA